MLQEALRIIAENKTTKKNSLNLSDLDLIGLPHELSECVWLNELHLSRNRKLVDLTPISTLVNLHKLKCELTNVSNLSPISGLLKLQELHFYKTPLEDLSPLSNLLNLRRLDIPNTLVSDLTPLKHLSRLEELYLFNTKINDLTPLAKLGHLRELYCSNTQVSDLGPLVQLIKSGAKVTLKGVVGENNRLDFLHCPLTNPPTEIAQQGNDAILRYFKDKSKQGEKKLYEAKIVVVGAGESGKTTLIKKLLDPTHPVPNIDDKRTEGIRAHVHTISE
ncbi:MAG: leucine-rich repeat domain-containing protein [Saprospiraceae bacterium]|nr:leucine-rich repeat domain-containing protein [Saprospiraceae bacterium]